MERRERRRQEAAAREAGRLPPGQALTEKWPVLSVNRPPPLDPATWRFTVTGLVDTPISLTYYEFLDLPQVKTTSDIHCVTRWSRLDNHWEGVSFRTIADIVRPVENARFVLFGCMVPYSTNLPLSECMEEGVLFAHSHDGLPLLPEHGWPLRLIVPQLYLWKSAKWVNSLKFLDKDQLGYWEKIGYHNEGDPWKEQRRSLNLGLRVPKRFRDR